MLHVTRISDNASLLYTGDFKTRKSRTAEAVSFLTADTLVMETTFGLPGYEFPNPLEIEAEILRFIHDGFADGETPVLLAYSLGKAQEALALLAENGIPALLHPAAAEMTGICREAGVPGLPEPVVFEGHAQPGHVVIAPPNSVRTGLLKGLASKRTAVLSGWALQPGAKFRYGVDAMIPLSDHADHPGLMECIQRVRPRRILTVHGYDKEFAAELRNLRMDAWCAAGGDQLELQIQRPAKRQPAPRGPWQKRVLCGLADFSDLCRLVTETSSRVAKTRFITAYLGALESDDDLRIAAGWLSGNILRRGDVSRAAKLEASTLRLALVSINGAREERLREIQLAQNDPARAARIFLQELQLRPDILDLTSTAAFIVDFLNITGSMERIQRLANRLASLHPSESETLVKLLAGDLRLGIDPSLVEEAIAAAFKADPVELHRAAGLTADPGETAVLARHRRLSEATKPAATVKAPSAGSMKQSAAELPFSPSP